jgi:hypothetical protein
MKTLSSILLLLFATICNGQIVSTNGNLLVTDATNTSGWYQGNGGGLTNLVNADTNGAGTAAAAGLSNLLGSAAYVSTNSFDTNGAAVAVTNGYPWGGLYDTNNAGIAAALAATNGSWLSASNLTVTATNGSWISASNLVFNATNNYVGGVTLGGVTNVVTNLINSATNNLTNVFAPITTFSYASANYSLPHGNTFTTVSNQTAVTLPTAVGYTNEEHTIKNIGTNVVGLITTSSQTIDGMTYGGIAGWTLVSGGSGYTVGQITDVQGVSAPAMLRVDTTSGSQMATATMMTPGQGYSVASGVSLYSPSGGSQATIDITSISTYIVSPQNNVVTVVSDGANWQTKVNRPAGLIQVGMACYFFGGAFNIHGTSDQAQLTLSSEFAEDNGQLITDVQSPMYNLVLPDVNGAGGQPRFLRGCTIASYQGMALGGQDSVTNVWSHRTGTGIASGTYWAFGPYTNVISTVPSFVSATVVTRIK